MHWIVSMTGVVFSLIGYFGNKLGFHIDAAFVYTVSSTLFALAYTMVVWKKLVR